MVQTENTLCVVLHFYVFLEKCLLERKKSAKVAHLELKMKNASVL